MQAPKLTSDRFTAGGRATRSGEYCMQIASIDVSSLFADASEQRRATDQAIYRSATETGFATITGLPAALAPVESVRRNLLRIFTLTDVEKRRLLRRNFDPDRTNQYRGFFPLQTGGASYKEGIDMGPDIAYDDWLPDASDPLTERTPLPPEAVLPGWHAAVGAYYRGMELLGARIMQSLARSLQLPDATFDGHFKGGISTLRLIRYPVRDPASLAGTDEAKVWISHKGARRALIGGAHIDSGFVTLLAQDGVEGLQAKSSDGTWIDVPPVEGSMAVNFGGLLERWTGGRIKATEHRVLGPGRERFSIPFFYEPRVDAIIRPLPGGAPFEPFTYGDHLWRAMTTFVEFRDLAGLRAPRGVARPS
jgi:isopenicillin N synthase-like dioxygenase